MSDQHALSLAEAVKLVHDLLSEVPAREVDIYQIDYITIERDGEKCRRYDPEVVRAHCREFQPKMVRRAFAIASEFDRLDAEGCSLETHLLMDELRNAGEAS